MSILGVRIFHVLRFVQNHSSKVHPSVLVDIPAEERIACDDKIRVAHFSEAFLTVRAHKGQAAQRWRKFRCLSHPVEHQRRRADNQRGRFVFGLISCEVGERLQRFAQAHLVRKDSAKPVPSEKMHPVNPLLLIWAQGLFQRSQGDFRHGILPGLLHCPLAPGGRSRDFDLLAERALQKRRMPAIHPVLAGALLVRVALREHALKFVQKPWVENREAPAFQADMALAHLQQPLNFCAGKSLPAIRLQGEVQLEPIFTGGLDVDAR